MEIQAAKFLSLRASMTRHIEDFLKIMELTLSRESREVAGESLDEKHPSHSKVAVIVNLSCYGSGSRCRLDPKLSPC